MVEFHWRIGDGQRNRELGYAGDRAVCGNDNDHHSRERCGGEHELAVHHSYAQMTLDLDFVLAFKLFELQSRVCAGLLWKSWYARFASG